ncbi:hypothetical protein ACLB2K_010968 [Fragaria x ananassa]
MAQRSHVPKFGNWEGEENVPYTAYFDKARKGRTGPGGKMINPNDPQENPDLLNDMSSVTSSPPRVRSEPERQNHEQVRSREDIDQRQYANSPAHRENLSRKSSGESTHQPGRGRGTNSGETHQRTARQSAGSEQSIERSPLHRQARASGRDSPSWEGKPSYESSHGTPGRSRLKPRDESPDKGAAVPKFGEWDENNPASADGFTHIFNKVREEKAGKVPGTPPEPSYYTSRKPAGGDSAKSCCFPWSRK